MTEEQTLTRNESAKLYSDVVGEIVTLAPVSTERIREFGTNERLGLARALNMHEDHLTTLGEQLNNQEVLNKIDELAVAARAAMTAVAVPWYDEPAQ